jgi:hypothetical protein
MSDVATAINRLFAQRRDVCRSRGLSMPPCGILAGAGCDTVGDIARLGRVYFESRPNCGSRTPAELAGWPAKPPTSVDFINTGLSLALADADEARDVAQDVAVALRRAGFVLVAERMRS